MAPPDDHGPDVRPLGAPVERSRAPSLVPIGIALALLALLLVSPAVFPSTSTTSTTVPVSLAVAPDFRLGLQSETDLWSIDPGALAVTQVSDGGGLVPWQQTLGARRVGEVFYLVPAERIDDDVLDGRVFALVPTEGDRVAGADAPVALDPVSAGAAPRGYDLVFVHPADAAGRSDAELPGCGLQYPVTVFFETNATASYCSESHLLHVFVPIEGEAAEDMRTQVLVVDEAGTLWTGRLDGVEMLAEAGSLALAPGERIPGILTLTPDGSTVLVGVTYDEVTNGTQSAGRIVAYDRLRDVEVWTVKTPLPFESLTVGPDGTIFAYNSNGGDSALMSVDPATGDTEVLIRPLDLGAGRLFVLES